MQAAKSFSLCLLGDCAARTAEGRELRISSRKGRALLAALALAREFRLGREHLASLLWGDRVDAQARQNLRQCLISLRKELGTASSALMTTTESIALDRDEVWIDVVEFDRLAAAGDTAATDRALALYAGPFLDHFNVDADGFTTWANAERERLERLAAKLLQQRAERLDAAGEARRAIEDAERLIALDPLREDWQRLALRLYARHNGRENALQHAERLAAHLKDELGAQLEPATRALVGVIMRDELSPDPAAQQPPGAVNGPQRTKAVPETSEDAGALAVSKTRGAGLALRTIMGLRGRGRIAAALVFAALIGGLASFSDTLPWSTRAAVSAPESAAISVRVVPVKLPTTVAAGGRDLAEAFTADLEDRLSRFDELRVVARPSNVGEAAKYSVAAAARFDEGPGRVSVVLIDNGDGRRIQVDQPELRPSGPGRDVILGRLARKLAIEMAILEGRKLPVDGELTEAQLIIKGRAARARGIGRENMAEMRAAFEQALIKDPNSVPALVGLLSALTSSWSSSVSGNRPNFDRAVQLLDRAVQIEPDSASVRYWIGVMYKDAKKYDLALRSFARAANLNPSYAPVFAQLGSTLSILGRNEEAVEQIEFAMQLSPDDPSLSLWAVFEARAQLRLGREAAALAVLERGEQVNPADANLHAFLAAVNMLLGNQRAAAGHAARFRALAAPDAVDVIARVLHDPAMLRAQQAFEAALKVEP
jgi:DNA-binding SARP family transcriptional activator/Flp pilus assembly protein TadD